MSTVHDRPITVFVVCAIFLVGPKPLRALVDDPLARLVTVPDRCVSRDGELISKLSLDKGQVQALLSNLLVEETLMASYKSWLPLEIFENTMR